MIDTHTHLFTEEFDNDRYEMVNRAIEAGVTKLFMPNIDVSSLPSLKKMCGEYKGVCFPMIGLHPTEVREDYKSQLDILEKELANNSDYIAIGEVGLDLYWDSTFKDEQIDAFHTQIGWAIDSDLPIIIHSRAASNELYNTLLPYKSTKLNGIFHSFVGDKAEAERLMEFPNFLFGINGVVTFKKSTLPEVLEDIPLSRIVLETDSPYLAPVPYRGKRNESSYIIDIAKKLSLIYDTPLNDISSITDDNALRLFKKVSGVL